MKSFMRNGGTLRVLGVDPAAAGPTGYAIVENDGKRSHAIHFGALVVADKIKNGCPGDALHAVYEKICNLIAEFSPDVLAVESIFTALNMKTALRLAEVRGVVLLAAAQHGLSVSSYAPREVKASVAGFGHADKRQIQLMVRAILCMDVTPEPTDAADALAVALCHLQREEVRRRFDIPAVVAATVPAQTAVRTSRGATRLPGLRIQNSR
jgi:crossover junction endodeoxyribonuclease RuvC